MKLNELFEVMNDTQFFDVYYKGNDGSLVKCASYNDRDSIDERFNEAEVINISVTKYNTFDILIEKVAMNKRYTVKFFIPDWLDLDEEVEIEFEDNEDDDEIEERIADEFRDWLDDKLRDLRDEADKEVLEIEEY